MGMWIGRNRKARVTYGFDEIALVPGEVTINPNEVDTSFQIPRKDGSAIKLKIPIIASAMDGVTDVRFCIAMGQLGGLLLSQKLEHTGKLAVLLSMDKVKMRQPVVPGDQLILEAVTVRVKSRTGHVRCKAFVGEKLAAEADIKFMLVDAEPI